MSGHMGGHMRTSIQQEWFFVDVPWFLLLVAIFSSYGAVGQHGNIR